MYERPFQRTMTLTSFLWAELASELWTRPRDAWTIHPVSLCACSTGTGPPVSDRSAAVRHASHSASARQTSLHHWSPSRFWSRIPSLSGGDVPDVLTDADNPHFSISIHPQDFPLVATLQTTATPRWACAVRTLCCCWLLSLVQLADIKHVAKGNLVRSKVTRGQSNLSTFGWFIIPQGDVTLPGPNREGVKGHTVTWGCLWQCKKIIILSCVSGGPETCSCRVAFSYFLQHKAAEANRYLNIYKT